MVLIFPSEKLRSPPVLFHEEKKPPAAVHLIATHHVISFSRKLLLRGQTAGVTSHRISRYGWQCIRRTASSFWRAHSCLAPCWDDELKQGTFEPFGSDFRDDQTHQDQVNLGRCAHVQVSGDFLLERNHCVKQVSIACMVHMLFSSSSVVQIITILDQYNIFFFFTDRDIWPFFLLFYSSTAKAICNAVYLFWQYSFFINKWW